MACPEFGGECGSRELCSTLIKRSRPHGIRCERPPVTCYPLRLEANCLNFATNLETCQLAPTKFCSVISAVRHPALSIREAAYKPFHA